MRINLDRVMRLSPFDRLLLAFCCGIAVGANIMALLLIWIVRTA